MSEEERNFLKKARDFFTRHRNQETRLQPGDPGYEPAKRKEAQNAEPTDNEMDLVLPCEPPKKSIDELMEEKRQLESAKNAQSAQELQRQLATNCAGHSPQALHSDAEDLSRQVAQGAISRKRAQGAQGAQGGHSDQDNSRRSTSRRLLQVPIIPQTEDESTNTQSSSSRIQGFTSRLGRFTPGRFWLAKRGLAIWSRFVSNRNQNRSTNSENTAPTVAQEPTPSTSQLRPYTGPLLDTASGGAPLPVEPLNSSSPDVQWERRSFDSSQLSLSASSSSSITLLSPRNFRKPALELHSPSESPFGSIQPDLYVHSTSPILLPILDSDPSFGRLHLRLKYDFDRSDLNVYVVEAHNVPSGECGGFNDPYIRMEIVPQVDSKRRETSSTENVDNNPIYNELFKFPVAYDELRERSLTFMLYDADHFTGSDFLGEVVMEMKEVQLIAKVEVWAEISRVRKPREEYQELLVSLSYLPSAQRLTVVVVKGRNLYVSPTRGTVDPFVKLYLMSEGKKMKKRRTGTIKGQRCPIWNEAFTFNISNSTLANSVMEFCVYDRSSEFLSSHTLLGCLLLGPCEKGEVQQHWQEATQSSQGAVAMWHKLR